MTRTLPGRLAALALALLALAGGARAESYPTRPVRIIVAFPPGGGTDIVARLLAQKLTELWGQQVVVDNRAGAAGVIGTELAAAATPDGYTLFVGTLGNLAVNPHLYASMRIDPLRAFAPVTQLVNVTFAAMAHPEFPPNTIAELIARAKAHPGEINFSSSGAGGAPHLAGELLKRTAQIDLVHVPYKGSGPSFQDLLAGQIPLTFDSLIQGLPHIREGRLKALAVLGETRSPLLPEVPTVAEAGVPGYQLTNWFGLVAPAATPPDTLAKIAADAAGALKLPDMRDKLTGMATEPVGNPPDDFAAVLRADTAKWGRIVKDANIRAE
jgi:tripartite-type tricarboxylate transporter receptor subunit TctC